jgi:hypothetical protein
MKPMERALPLILLAVLGFGACSRELPTEAPRAVPSPTPTPSIYWNGSIRCSYQGGPPEPCPACPDGVSSCALPPGWTAVCVDSHGRMFPCP